MSDIRISQTEMLLNTDKTSHETQSRKADHLRVCLDDDVQSGMTTGLEQYRFEHVCLPELDWAEMDLSTQFLNRELHAPLLISSMTGGTELAKTINFRLARSEEHTSELSHVD